MHGPSEHRFEGQQYDLEIHIVHELVSGPMHESTSNYKETLCVVSFLFKIDKFSHPFIKKLRPNDFGHIDKISFADLLPAKPTFAELEKQHQVDHHIQLETPTTEPTFYHYKGSLTNPPCADVVNWVIHTEVLPIRESHLQNLKAVWNKNLNGCDNYRDC